MTLREMFLPLDGQTFTLPALVARLAEVCVANRAHLTPYVGVRELFDAGHANGWFFELSGARIRVKVRK